MAHTPRQRLRLSANTSAVGVRLLRADDKVCVGVLMQIRPASRFMRDSFWSRNLIARHYDSLIYCLEGLRAGIAF